MEAAAEVPVGMDAGGGSPARAAKVAARCRQADEGGEGGAAGAGGEGMGEGGGRAVRNGLGRRRRKTTTMRPAAGQDLLGTGLGQPGSQPSSSRCEPGM